MDDKIDLVKFFTEFQDYLAPKLDTYEQAIYLYIFRHSRLIGLKDVVIGFKSERKKLASGVGERSVIMAENTVYKRIKEMESKGYLKVLGTEFRGQRFQLNLPHEISGLVPEKKLDEQPQIDIEDIDFFQDPVRRIQILERDANCCFYCAKKLNTNTYVMEHVVSRPQGNNSYRNLVAACRDCNNSKNNSPADDFLRSLYRRGLITGGELEERLDKLIKLKNGELKPQI